MLKLPVRYSADVEKPRADEAQTIEALNDAFRDILETTSGNYGRAVRAVHAKGHALLEGVMTIESGLEPALAQGLFAKPGHHRICMRMSTNAGDLLPDTIGLPRGIAIKVLDVEGERLPGAEGTTQDFILINARTFSAQRADQFLGNLKLLARTTDKATGAKEILSGVLRAVNRALGSVGVESATVKQLGGAPNVDPLGAVYWSATPFRHGDHIAKFKLVPVAPAMTARFGAEIETDGERPDAIRDTVREEMKGMEAVWEFQVQLCRDLDRQPVEDPTVEWREDEAPFVRVATIRAAAQDSWSPERVEAIDERMRFSVWTGLEAHRPLGDVNRARRETYRMSAGFRSRFNRCPIHEPTAQVAAQ